MAYQGKHAMISYAHREKSEMIIDICQSFALDNGAFSAWKAGFEFDIEGFHSWLLSLYRHPGFDWYVIPDVIGGSEEDNKSMQEQWHTLCKGTDLWNKGYVVWHPHESLDRLKYFTTAFTGVCFGGSDEYDIDSPKWWARMSEAMDVVTDDQGRPRVPLHGLRLLNIDIFTKLPLKSADSTNASRHCGSPERWKGAYIPMSISQRALVIMDRIEHFNSAPNWCGDNVVPMNGTLF